MNEKERAEVEHRQLNKAKTTMQTWREKVSPPPPPPRLRNQEKEYKSICIGIPTTTPTSYLPSALSIQTGSRRQGSQERRRHGARATTTGGAGGIAAGGSCVCHGDGCHLGEAEEEEQGFFLLCVVGRWVGGWVGGWCG